MSGFCGLMAIAEMRSVSLRPMCCHVLPPSVDLYTPSPNETLLRTFDSPVPTQTTSGLPGASAMSRSEEHTSELQSQSNLVCRLLLEKKKKTKTSGRV